MFIINTIENFNIDEETKAIFEKHFMIGILYQLHKENLLSDDELKQGVETLNS